MAAPGHGGKRILLVDDDFTTQEAMSMILAANGYRVAVARNGVDALERLRGFEPPELILVDLRMPVMDGRAFCAACRAEAAARSVPLVVVSGSPDADEQAARIGAAACLHKPVDVSEMLATVRALCAAAPAATAPGA